MAEDDMGQELLEVEQLVGEEEDGEALVEENGGVEGAAEVEAVEMVDVEDTVECETENIVSENWDDVVYVHNMDSWENLLEEKEDDTVKEVEVEMKEEVPEKFEEMVSFLCSVCGKSFNARKKLGDHVRYHHKNPTTSVRRNF